VSATLAELCRAEFLLCGDGAANEYAFKHPVTKRVAYESQLRARRAVVHGRVAEVLAATPGAVQHDAALIAHHFELAERRTDAARWSIHAAEVAGGWDSAQTMRHLHKVRELAGSSPERSELRDLAVGAGVRALAFGVFAGIERSEADRIFSQTRALIADEPSNALAALHAWYSNWLDNAEQPDAGEHARRAQELAEASHHPRALLDVAWAVLRYLSDAGQLREAVEFGERALARVDPARASSLVTRGQIANTHLQLSQYLGLLGRPHASIAAAERAEALANALHDPQGPVIAARVKSSAARLLGRVDDELRFALDAVERAQQWENPLQRLICGLVFARALLSHCRLDEARVQIEHVEARIGSEPAELTPTSGRRVWLALAGMRLVVRAELELASGDVVEALRYAELAHEHMRERARLYPPYRADVWRVLARALIQRDASAHAERSAEVIAELEAVVRDCELGSYVPLLHELRAEYACALGDERTRARELTNARSAFLELGAELQVARLDRMKLG
ncbi:MAG TPA: hypothetical protein VK509_23725, partial [Polyangiales bacterium]|nr:hypothetical protein [Polyangiales bacterium]